MRPVSGALLVLHVPLVADAPPASDASLTLDDLEHAVAARRGWLLPFSMSRLSPLLRPKLADANLSIPWNVAADSVRGRA